MYAGYYPMGLSLERIFAEMPERAVPRPRVAEVPARERDARVQAATADGDASHRVRGQRPRRARRSRPSSRCCGAGPTALRIGKNVRAFEQRRRRAVRQAPRDHVQLRLVGALPRGRAARAASPATRSSPRRSRSPPTSRPLVRAGLVPVFVDVEPDTYNIDVDAHRGDDRRRAPRRSSRRTSSATRPTGTASAPSPTRTGCRWSRTRATRSARRCGARPPGTRSDISVTSFALVAHHHRRRHRRHGAARRRRRSPTAACCCGGGAGAPRCSSSARRRATKRFFSQLDDGLEYDNLFIFDEVGWNFEPSELSRRVRRSCSCASCPRTSPGGSATSTCCREHFATLPRRVRAARARSTGSTPAGTCSRSCIRPESRRAPGDVPAAHGGATASTRAWCGPATSLRQPAFKGVAHRAPRRRAAQRRPGDGAGPDPARRTTASTTTTSTTSGQTVGGVPEGAR